jgi:parallel beta-helix repeat protein
MRLKALVLALLVCPGAAFGQATQGGPLGVPLPLFPADNWWNVDISQAPVDPRSASFINFIGGARRLHPDFGGYEDPGPPPSDTVYGFPYVVVNGNTQPKRAVQFLYSDESDGVDHNTDQSFPFYPIPDEAITQAHWIEGGQPGDQNPPGDRHMLIVDKDNNHLYELYDLFWNGTEWTGGSGAFFDMSTNNRRPEGWTSGDAAGLAILPGLVRYDEVYGPDPIRHAFRFTVQATNGHVYPASHTAGSTPGALPMGARVRLKATKNISGFAPEIQKIFQAMKTYGMMVADNGSNMYVSGTFDPNWDNDVLNPAFDALKASDFEVIQLGWTPPTSGLSVGDAAVTEGNSGTVNAVFTVTLAPAATQVVSVNYATAQGTARAGLDYLTKAGVLTFAPGVTARTVAVAVKGDVLDEDDEAFSLVLSKPKNAFFSDASGQATILDNDLEPELSIADLVANEGDAGVSNALFKVKLSALSGRAVSVDYDTTDGPALAGMDYVATSGTLTIPAGKLTGAVAVPILGGVVQESTETFSVGLASPVNAGIAQGQAVGTILDDDLLPTISVLDAVSITEGNSGTQMALFTVTLSTKGTRTITVRYTAVAGSAVPGDFKPKTGVLTFPPGVTNQAANVAVVGDTRLERNEVFMLRLNSPAGGKIGRAVGQAVIVDDDGPADACQTPIIAIPFTIAVPGQYCLARNVTTTMKAGAAITVAADGVSLDLQNFALTDSASALTQAVGIFADQRQNVTVKNGTVRGFFTGILLQKPAPYSSPQGLLVDRVKALNSRYAGIWLEGMGNTVSMSHATATGRTTALGPFADAWGIVSRGPNASLSGNLVLGTVGTGGGAACGIALAAGDAATVSANRVTGVATPPGTGILLDGSASVTVDNNILATLTYGIVFANGATGTASGNTFTGVGTPQVGP